MRSTLAVSVALAAATMLPGTASAHQNTTGMAGLNSKATAAAVGPVLIKQA